MVPQYVPPLNVMSTSSLWLVIRRTVAAPESVTMAQTPTFTFFAMAPPEGVCVMLEKLLPPEGAVVDAVVLAVVVAVVDAVVLAVVVAVVDAVVVAVVDAVVVAVVVVEVVAVVVAEVVVEVVAIWRLRGMA